MGLFSKAISLPSAAEALPGRSEAVPVPSHHFVNGNPLTGPFPDGFDQVLLGMGCFWGAERIFWQLDGVYTTAAGYAGGQTPNPTYEEVCSGGTGHTEVVLVVWDSSLLSLETLLTTFWESHDPTQGMRQGNDLGTQYRSCLYTQSDAHLNQSQQTLTAFQAKLSAANYPAITTELAAGEHFYYAEHYHQQYLAKVPNGYCGIGGTGVCY